MRADRVEVYSAFLDLGLSLYEPVQWMHNTGNKYHLHKKIEKLSLCWLLHFMTGKHTGILLFKCCRNLHIASLQASHQLQSPPWCPPPPHLDDVNELGDVLPSHHPDSEPHECSFHTFDVHPALNGRNPSSSTGNNDVLDGSPRCLLKSRPSLLRPIWRDRALLLIVHLLSPVLDDDAGPVLDCLLPSTSDAEFPYWDDEPSGRHTNNAVNNLKMSVGKRIAARNAFGEVELEMGNRWCSWERMKSDVRKTVCKTEGHVEGKDDEVWNRSRTKSRMTIWHRLFRLFCFFWKVVSTRNWYCRWFILFWLCTDSCRIMRRKGIERIRHYQVEHVLTLAICICIWRIVSCLIFFFFFFESLSFWHGGVSVNIHVDLGSGCIVRGSISWIRVGYTRHKPERSRFGSLLCIHTAVLCEAEWRTTSMSQARTGWISR